MLSLIAARVEDGSLGQDYPDQCPDGLGPIGTSRSDFRAALAGYRLPDPTGHGVADTVSNTELFDLIEFTYEKIAKPTNGSWHPFFNHYHLHFDRAAGRDAFTSEINRLFSRNGLAYELSAEGQVSRLVPVVLDEPLTQSVFQTGDPVLDQLLESARLKFSSSHEATRGESLEKLWDAWERLKSLEPGLDKKASVTALLDRSANNPTFREVLEKEAKELTAIGNTFRIRHSELHTIAVESSAHVDYLFHRLFAFIRLLLKASGRGG